MSRTFDLVTKTLQEVSELQGTGETQKESKGVFRTFNSLFRRWGHSLIPTEYAEHLKRRQVAPVKAAGMLRELLTVPERFDAIYPLLEDQESKDILDRLIRFRAAWPCLGAAETTELYPAPLTMRMYEDAIRDCEEKSREIGIPAKYVALLWELNHYSLRDICEVESGDVVFDIGAFRGDSALFFAEKCGPEGKVYAFEALPGHASEIKRHALNAKAPVEVVPLAAWDRAEALNITASGGESTVNQDGHGEHVDADTIDHVVEEWGIEKVDFIKMDIEGAEFKALQGARGTIGRHKPKLAISVYHLADDLYTIPNLIREFNPEYRLFLRQYHPRHDETVLYAVQK
jgi:FkbM family methyltransferase